MFSVCLAEIGIYLHVEVFELDWAKPTLACLLLCLGSCSHLLYCEVYCDISVFLGIVHKHGNPLISLHMCIKAKWRAFSTNDNISILAQFDGHVSIQAPVLD
jgi:hypothetical protein